LAVWYGAGLATARFESNQRLLRTYANSTCHPSRVG